jgi:HEXXH motif-containing protein
MSAVIDDRVRADIDLFAFPPNADRGHAVESRVRGGLADSLAAVLRALGSLAPPPTHDFMAHLRAAPVSPSVFGAYTEIVEAIFYDDLGRAAKIAEELCAPGFGVAGDLRLITLRDCDLGEGQADRYRRLIDNDPEVGIELRALAPAEFASDSKRVADALALLEAATPELFGELRALIREIVFVDTVGHVPFGGASSFQLWGALFLKLSPNASRIDIAGSLAHEGAHALLFGFSMGKPLVENRAEEVYPSPLRSDLRPMDGVVHATYVISRMHYTTSRLLESGLLSQDEERAARDAMERHAHHFLKGLAVIEEHARWTEVGESAFGAATRYMAAVA